MECENCGGVYDPIATRWKCPHCGWKAHCCEGLPTVTVAEMAGLFEGGPDSVGWLREQRDCTCSSREVDGRDHSLVHADDCPQAR